MRNVLFAVLTVLLGVNPVFAGQFAYKGLTYLTKDWPVADGMVGFSYQGKWGFAETDKWNVIIPPQYAGVSEFSEGKALALTKIPAKKSPPEFAWIDKSGKETPCDPSIPSKIKGKTPVYYSAGDMLYVIAFSGLIIRDTPSIDGKKLTTVPLGGKVTVIELPSAKDEYLSGNIPGYWVRVQVGDTTGWMFDGYLSGFCPVCDKGDYMLNLFKKAAADWTGNSEHVTLNIKKYNPNENCYESTVMKCYFGASFSLVEMDNVPEAGMTEELFFYGFRYFELFQHMKVAGIIPKDKSFPGEGVPWKFFYYEVDYTITGSGVIRLSLDYLP